MSHNAAAFVERLPDFADGQKHWIRLFELDPGPSCPTTSTTDGLYVSGRLLKCSLTDCPPYLALSYSWGEQPTLVPFVVGSHEDFLISLDLHYALRNLRHEHQPRYVWIDTICINQVDIPERNSQVKIMREVYARAESVCIWLGMPPVSAGDLTGARLQDIKYDVVQHIASRGVRNWWRRRWVVQEVAAAATEPVVLLGNLRLPWKGFIRHCVRFNMRLRNSDIDQETVREISTFSTILGTRMSFRNTNKYTCNLEFLLRSTVDFHASVPHDAIYAVLGLADDEAKQAVRVDYNMSIIDLYAEITELLVGERSWESTYPLDVLVSNCWQRLMLAEPSWILDFAHRSIHSASWGQFDDQTMSDAYSMPGTADVRANDDASTQSMGLSNELLDRNRKWSSQADTTVCGGHVTVKSVNDNELRASFGKDPRTMTCSGFVIGVIRNIISVHEHLLSLRTESQPATVDESAIHMKLQCSKSKLASAFRRFEDIHQPYLCSVDQMVVFVTVDGDIGMCYSTMADGRPGLDTCSAVLRAGDHVVCVYGLGSPAIVRMSAGDLGKYFCLLLPCMFMQDCECYTGQPHSVEAFKRMTFV
jgi:hypothetical protein